MERFINGKSKHANMSPTKSERDYKLSVLEDIVDSETLQKISEIEGPEEFAYETDIKFLNHILDRAGVTLNDHTKRTVDEELDEWDREHLVDLAKYIDKYTLLADRKEKFTYIISHSIEGDLTTALLSNKDQFANYNKIALNAYAERGIDVEKWLNPGEKILFTTISQGNDSIQLEVQNWSRDFRKEFAMGNDSECCIEIGGKSKNEKYSHIILDYFLDLTIQAAHIFDVTKPESREVGQIFFVGLDKQEKGEDIHPVLGVTTVELSKDYKQNKEIIPGIMEAVFNQSSYNGAFPTSEVAVETPTLSPYFAERRQQLGNMASYLKKERSQTRDKKRPFPKDTLIAQGLQRQIERISDEIEIVDDLTTNILKRSDVKLWKIGLADAVEAEEKYVGTNYLDIVAGPNWDGFFNPRRPRPTVKAIVVKSPDLFRKIDSTYFGLRTKYIESKRALKT